MAAAIERLDELESMGLEDNVYVLEDTYDKDILNNIAEHGGFFTYNDVRYEWWKLDRSLSEFVDRQIYTIFDPYLYKTVNVEHKKEQIAIKNHYNSMFFEEQRSLGCGRHALNNLFGERHFIKNGSLVDKKGDLHDKLTGLYPVPLMNVCHMYQTHIAEISSEAELNYCPSNEYYDYVVIILGLSILGAGSDILDLQENLDKENEKEADVIGYIINFPGHWVALRKNVDAKVKLVNSTTRNHIEYENFSEFFRKHVVRMAIKVYRKPKETLKNTINKFLLIYKESNVDEKKRSATVLNDMKQNIKLMLDNAGISEIENINKSMIALEDIEQGVKLIEIMYNGDYFFDFVKEIVEQNPEYFEQKKNVTAILNDFGEWSKKKIMQMYIQPQSAGSSKPKKYRLNY